jgi:hypothetical protein
MISGAGHSIKGNETLSFLQWSVSRKDAKGNLYQNFFAFFVYLCVFAWNVLLKNNSYLTSSFIIHMRIVLFVIASFVNLVLYSQNLLPTPRNIQATYVKGTRSVDGRPGKNYWQNTANYDLRINFDPATRLINGSADIQYVNNSPDTLRSIYFKLYPNFYKAGTPRQMPVDPEDIGEGIVIDSLWINNIVSNTASLVINGTNGFIGRQSLLPHQTMQIRIVYHYILNKTSHIRTGEIEPNAAFIAYFFPRIAVYDDIDGWNTIPYTGTQEFYNDFCNFKTAITVPKNFVVWATGDLKNGRDVLAPVYYQRLQQAEQNDAIIYIIDSTDLKKGNITASQQSYNTWRFEADSVTDFTFALSDHYLWQSSSLVVDPKTKRRTRVDAAFNPVHKDYFHVASDARKTVDAMSYHFPAWPFPFPHITVFDGLDQMEYPMMINDNPVDDRHESISLTDHEVFHQMFPFYTGLNETKYAWMDEGWATLGEWLISPMIDSTIVDTYGVMPYARSAGTESDLPITTLSIELNRGYFTNSYPKPAMGLLYIKDYLGDALFNKATHHFITQWKGKHPMPNDFFYSMNQGSGKNLNWFWEKWFFEDGVPDLALSSVKINADRVKVVVDRKGNKPVPVDLIVYYKDGTTQKIHRSITVWEKERTLAVINFTASQHINKIVLSDPHTPESYPRDNVWEAK